MNPADNNTDQSITPASTDGAAAAAPANENAPKASAWNGFPKSPDPVVEKKPLHKNSKLMAAFNIAAGAGMTMAAKAATTTLLASFAVPAVATLVTASLVVGAVSTAWVHHLENKQLKKNGLSTQKFWSKEKRRKNLSTFAKSSGFALIGGALVLGFTEGVFDKLFGSTPAPAAVPDVAAAPVVVSATERFAALAGTDAAVEVKQALARAASENAAVAAQGTKDLGYYAFNGVAGVAKDQTLAVELFRQAADAGNLQAKVDMAYIQYHGLAGVAADKAAAMTAMQDIPTAKAASFVKAWTP